MSGIFVVVPVGSTGSMSRPGRNTAPSISQPADAPADAPDDATRHIPLRIAALTAPLLLAWDVVVCLALSTTGFQSCPWRTSERANERERAAERQHGEFNTHLSAHITAHRARLVDEYVYTWR